jgi:leader peptidase (prepilin peptidase)/N-methyltransferase
MRVEEREAAHIPPTKAGLAKIAFVAVAALGALAASVATAPGLNGAAGTALAAICLTIAIFDYRLMIIPDELNALALVTGVAAAGLETSPANAILTAVIRAGVMFAAFFLFRFGYRRLRGVEGIGLGDVKLAAVAGAWLDWPDLPIVVDVAALSALTAAILARLRGHKLHPMAKLPFGVFFAPSIWACWWLAASRGGPM